MTADHAQVPETISLLEAAFWDQIKLGDRLEREVSEFEARLQQITGNQYERSNIKVSAPYAPNIVESYFERVERFATTALSVAGGEFVPSHQARPSGDFYGSFYDKTEEAKAKIIAHCSPLAHWKSLIRFADPAQQRAVHAKKCARALARMLGMISYRDFETKLSTSFVAPSIVKGCAEIPFSGVYVTEGFSSSKNVSVSADGYECATSLSYALVHEDAPELAGIGDALDSRLREYARNRAGGFVSRERTDLGNGASLVAFAKGFKLYLPQVVAGHVNMFITEHMPELFAQQQSEAA